MRLSPPQAALAAIAIALPLALTVFVHEAPDFVLASTGCYTSSCPPCAGGPAVACYPGKSLCCVVVRDRFHPHCNIQPGCSELAVNGIDPVYAAGVPTGDGTTGLGATPKYKSTREETVSFFGYVRICPETTSNIESWIMADGIAEVYLDGRPHLFLPEADLGPTHYYSDKEGPLTVICTGEVTTNNTVGSDWTDGPCPVNLDLASGLKNLNNNLGDGRWHSLEVVYHNPMYEGVAHSTHVQCTHPTRWQYNWDGVTLYMGCGIEMRDFLLPEKRISVPHKLQKVSLHGIPVPEVSPTAEGETDQPQDRFLVDVFNSVPSISAPEVSVPMDGGELSLEFRRFGGVTTSNSSTHIERLPITYPTDDLLGLGWSCNLSARAIVHFPPSCADTPPKVSIIGPGGTPYYYILEPGNVFRPEVTHSQDNASLRASVSLVGNDLLVKQKHGTELLYTKIGRFYQSNSSVAGFSQDYYKLISVTDRNGNSIEYMYETGMVHPAGQMLVSQVRDADHHERKILFEYSVIGGQLYGNGYDWHLRLTKVTNPLGDEIHYEYTISQFPDILPSGSKLRPLLTKVTYPEVPVYDANNPLLTKSPTEHYAYDTRTSLGSEIGNQVPPFDRVLHAGVSAVWNNSDTTAKTVFTYASNMAMLPVAVYPKDLGAAGFDFGAIEYNAFLVLNSVVTADGATKTQFSTPFREIVPCQSQGCTTQADFNARSVVIDARKHAIEYVWEGTIRELSPFVDPVDPFTGELVYTNELGWATGITRLTRLTKDAAGDNDEDALYSTQYTYAPDLLDNLTLVRDMNGTLTFYDFWDSSTNSIDLQSRIFRQPRRKTSAGGLVTEYSYDSKFRKLVKVVDAAGKVVRYTLDGNGNRTSVIRESTQLGNAVDTFEFLANGQLSAQVDAEGLRTTFTVFTNPSDLAGDFGGYRVVVSTADPTGAALVDKKCYSVMGLVRESIPPEGNASGNAAEYKTRFTYDARGKLLQTVKPSVPLPGGAEAATTETRHYDLRGNMVREVVNRLQGADPVVTEMGYDELGRVRQSRILMDPEQGTSSADLVTFQFYDNMGQLEREVDARGNEVEMKYDILLRPIEKNILVTDHISATEFTQSDLYERWTYGEYSGSGAFNYTRGWKPVRVLNRRGCATDMKYDPAFRLIQAVNRREGALPVFPSDPPRDEEVQPDGTVLLAEPSVSMTYNSVGNVVKTSTLLEAGPGGMVRNEYNFYDDFHRTTVVVVDVDSSGEYESPVNAWVNDWTDFSANGPTSADIVVKTRYDKRDLVVEMADPDDNVSSREYDAVGRLEYEIGPDVNGERLATRYGYNKNGQVQVQQGPFPWQGAGTVPSGAVAWTVYDKQGRVVESVVDLNGDGVQGPEDAVSKTEYDLVGNVLSVTDPTDVQTWSVYDKANRAVETRMPPMFNPNATPPGLEANPRAMTTYDAKGNVVESVDFDGNIAQNAYDELGRVYYSIVGRREVPGSDPREFDDADATEARMRYDDNGNVMMRELKNIVDGTVELQQTWYDYDCFDRVVREERPGANSPAWEWEYYRDGVVRVSRMPSGKAVEYDYDRVRRVVESRHLESDGTTYETRRFKEYDKRGNLLEVCESYITDPLGVFPNRSLYEYDEAGRVSKETRYSDGQATYELSKEYGSNGLLNKTIYPGGREIDVVYDGANRLLSIVDQGSGGGSLTTSYERDKAGRISRMVRPEGGATELETVVQFDDWGRASSKTLQVVGGAVRYSASYEMDLLGNIVEVAETIDGQSKTVEYEYDAQARLVGETWPGLEIQYEYDKAGNRLSKTIDTASSLETWTGTFSESNAIAAVEYDDGSGSGTIQTTFSYDNDGNRVLRQQVGEPDTSYQWDASGRLIAVKEAGATVFEARYDYQVRRLVKTEWDSGVATVKDYAYDGGTVVEERPGGGAGASAVFVYGEGLGAGIGGVLYEERGGSRYFGEYNQVGHKVVDVAEDGTLAAWHRYEAFGEVLESSAVGVSTLLANTRELDGSTKLYNHGHRYYDYATGLYLSQDPAGYVDGANLYQYVGNNPVVRFDPDGQLYMLCSQIRSNARTVEHAWNLITTGESEDDEGNKFVWPWDSRADLKAQNSLVGVEFKRVARETYGEFGEGAAGAALEGAAVLGDVANIAHRVVGQNGLYLVTFGEAGQLGRLDVEELLESGSLFSSHYQDKGQRIADGNYNYLADGVKDAGQIFVEANPVTGAPIAIYRIATAENDKERGAAAFHLVAVVAPLAKVKGVLRKPGNAPKSGVSNAKFVEYKALRAQGKSASEAHGLMKQFDAGNAGDALFHFTNTRGAAGILRSGELRTTSRGFFDTGLFTSTVPNRGVVLKSVPIIGHGTPGANIRIPLLQGASRGSSVAPPRFGIPPRTMVIKNQGQPIPLRANP